LNTIQIQYTVRRVKKSEYTHYAVHSLQECKYNIVNNTHNTGIIIQYAVYTEYRHINTIYSTENTGTIIQYTQYTEYRFPNIKNI